VTTLLCYVVVLLPDRSSTC